MGMPVRIDDQLYEQAKAHAQAERRTIAGQLEFWAMVGKTALELGSHENFYRNLKR